MNHWVFVTAGYLIVFVGLIGYAAWLLARGRSLTAEVPEERRRFLD